MHEIVLVEREGESVIDETPMASFSELHDAIARLDTYREHAKAVFYQRPGRTIELVIRG